MSTAKHPTCIVCAARVEGPLARLGSTTCADHRPPAAISRGHR